MNGLRFDNRFVRELPGEPEAFLGTRQVHGALWSPVQPTPVAAPKRLAVNPELAHAIGFAAEDLENPIFPEVFAGNRQLPGMYTYATSYGGHQFGHWAGQLGDGRVIGLGEVIGTDGNRYELQLKGAGRTPYSRFADGRAVLRSSLREFVCSEAMHHLGIPSTRALSLTATGETVVRDVLYTGDPQPEPGAIVCRVAPSFLRFGHFELPASRGDTPLLRRLLDFTLARDFPHLHGPNAAADGFIEICERTSLLLAHWMRVGFVHGVMNTDNLSILGLTIDYGPYGWLEDFDLHWTPNTTDAAGRRYCFGRQPQIAYWNLARLAAALKPLFDDPAPLEQGLRCFVERFAEHHAAMLAAKLGLTVWREETDRELVDDLYRLLSDLQADFTLFFRGLAAIPLAAPTTVPLESAFYDPRRREVHASRLHSWLTEWARRVAQEHRPDALRRTAMEAANPLYVCRNWLAQEAIDAASQGDLAPLHDWLEVLRRPYTEQPGREHFAARRPDWALNRPGCSMLSCSS